MPGRKIWNQHAYHITNVNPDGSIPATADRNWLTYNNFRSGDLTPGEGYSGPDLIANVEGVCTDECDADRLFVWASVGNAGYQDVEDDVMLQIMGVLVDGTEVELASRLVTDTIPAAQTLDAVQFVIESIPPRLDHLYAAIDGGDNTALGVVDECIEINNVAVYHENLCQ